MRRIGLPAGLLLAVFLLRLPTVIGEWGFASTDETSWICRNIAPMLLGDLNPRLFEYPAGVVFTLVPGAYALVYGIGHAAGYYGTLPDFVALMRAEPWAFAVIGRLMTVLAGALGVVALHRLALRVADPGVATWAAGSFGLMVPFATITCFHYVDVPAIACLLFALPLCLDIREGRRDTRTLVKCGLVFGTLVNLKIPYVLCVVAVAAALWLAPDRARRVAPRPELARLRPAWIVIGLGAMIAVIARRIVLPATYDPSLALGVGAVANFRRSVLALAALTVAAGLAAVVLAPARRVLNAALLSRTARVTALTGAVTFLAWSPYYFADPTETVMGVMRMMRPVDWEVVGPRPPTFHALILRRSTSELLGLPMGLLGLAGIAVALARRDPRDLVVLSPVGTWFAYTGFAAYTKLSLMYLYAPFLALYGARLARDICGPNYHALLAVALLPAAVTCAGRAWTNATVPRVDTRQELRAWYRAACPSGEPVAQDPGLLIHDDRNPDYYQPLLCERDLGQLKASGVRYLLTNDNIDRAYHVADEKSAAFRAELALRATPVTTFSTDGGRKAGPPIQVWRLR